MTEEDREQLRQIIREEITNSREETTKEFTARLDRAVESVGNDFSELREEMNRRFDQVDHRFEAVERGLERVETRLTAVEFQTAGINRTLDQSERSGIQLIATQTAQQRAIDDLAARVRRIERELHPEDKP